MEEVDLQLNLEGFKKEEVISGEELENTLDFEAQRKRLFPLLFLAFSVDKKNSLHKQIFFFFLEDLAFLPEGAHVSESSSQRPYCG